MLLIKSKPGDRFDRGGYFEFRHFDVSNSYRIDSPIRNCGAGQSAGEKAIRSFLIAQMMVYLIPVIAFQFFGILSSDVPRTFSGDNTMQEILDKSGNEVVLPIETREISGFSREGLAPVRLVNGETAVIDKTGKLLFNTDRDRLTVFEDGMSVFQDPITYLWGVFASSGEKIVEAKYHWISPFCDGYAIATRKTDKSILVLNREGRIVTQIEKAGIAHDFLPPCEKLIPFGDVETNLRGFIDFESKIVVPAKFVEVGPFREHLASVLVRTGTGFKVGFINTKGEFDIEPRFPIDSELSRETTDFSEGIAFVPSLTSFADKVAINSKGEELFKVNVLSIERMVDGRAAFADHVQGWGYLDSKGKVIIEPIYGRATNFGSGFAVVSKDIVSWHIE